MIKMIVLSDYIFLEELIMKSLKNWKKALVLSGVLVSGAFGFLNSNDAYAAGNYSDSPFTFIFEKWDSSSSATTENRPKYDATSAYMKTSYVGDSSKDDYKYTGYVEKSDGTNLDNNGNWRYTFNDYTTRYLYNNGYEKYGYGVQVHIKAEAGWNVVDVGAAGQWSPDSI